MNGQKLLLLLFISQLLFQGSLLGQQKIILSDLRVAAIKSSTQMSQQTLADQSLKINNALAKIGYLPKLSLGGTASYQTDVTTLPISFPGVEIPSPQKDQYKVSLDLQQTIYDGGATRAGLAMNAASAHLESVKVIYDKQKILELTDQLFYAGLSLQIQSENLSILENQLEQKLAKVNENISQGTMSKLSASQIKVKLIELSQQQEMLKAKSTSTKQALGLLTGINLSDTDIFELQETEQTMSKKEYASPEINLLLAQQSLVSAADALTDAKFAPKLSLNASLAYGRPGLNFLSRDFDTYGLASLQLRIPIDHFYTKQKMHEKALNQLKMDAIDDQLTNARRGINIKLQNIEADIAQLENTIVKDQELLELRQDIAKTIEVQYDNGIITERDYLEELENVNVARNNMALHKIQLAQAIDQWKLLIGNF